MVVSTVAHALDFKYTILSGTGVRIDRYTGTGGAVIIPEKVKNLPVVSISDWAFVLANDVTSITIPRSVTFIDPGAIYGCTNLTSLKVSASNPVFSSSGGVLFNKDQTQLLRYPPGKHGDYTIPDGVTSIGEFAFSYGARLRSLTVPDSVKTIENHAFYYCSSLTVLTLDNGLSSIGEYAFSDCVRLSSITIPDSVESIGTSAFYECISLNAVTIPGSVVSVGTFHFYGCSNLAAATIQDGVTVISYGMFSGCSKLGNITIPTTVTSIEDYAFSGCESLTSVTLPESVTAIGHRPFSGCTRLRSIEVSSSNPDFSSADGVLLSKDQTNLICCPEGKTADYLVPSSVTRICNGAFRGCAGLTNITLGSGLAEIGIFAFEGCTGLSAISIPAGVGFIGSNVFSGCKNLLSISVSPSNPFFSSLEGVVFDKNQTLIVQYPPGRIGNYSIPDGVVSILSNAFFSCTKLTRVAIPDGVTSIGLEAFSGCTGLSGVSISNTVISIGGEAFLGCASLTGIALPSSIRSIDYRAFADCENLRSALFDGNAPSMSSDVFEGVATDFRVFHFDGARGFTSPKWNGYRTSVIPFSYAIVSGTGISITGYSGAGQTISIPDRIANLPVNAIGKNAFRGCAGVSKINIPTGITSIAAGAFRDCSALTSINIPEAVTYIGNGAFSGCSKLRSALFEGRSAPSMGGSVFDNTAQGFAVYYFNMANGFTSPAWHGYRSVNLGTERQITIAVTEAVIDEYGPRRTFARFGSPAINDAGQVAWQAKMREFPGSEIWMEDSGDCRRTAETGDYFFYQIWSTFKEPVLNANGNVAFVGTSVPGIDGTRQGNATGIWMAVSDLANIVVSAGMQAPGCPSGARFAAFSRIALTDSDETVFSASLGRGPGGVTSGNDRGVWCANREGALRLLLREGDGFTVRGANKTVDSFTLLKPSVHAGAQSRSYNRDGWITGSVKFTDGTSAIFEIQPGGGVELVAITGNPAPGIAGATFSGFAEPAINDQGSIAFRANVLGGDAGRAGSTAIWADAGTTWRLVAQTGAAAPGVSAGRFAELSDPVYNNNGQVAFHGVLQTGPGGAAGVDANGIWSDFGGSLDLVARSGAQAPGCPPGTKFKCFPKVALPDQGGAIILAKLITGHGGVRADDDKGLWAVDTANQLQLIVRTGGVVRFDSGHKFIADISIFNSSSVTAGQSRSFNRVGDLTYKLTFTDGTEAICKVVFP